MADGSEVAEIRKLVVDARDRLGRCAPESNEYTDTAKVLSWVSHCMSLANDLLASLTELEAVSRRRNYASLPAGVAAERDERWRWEHGPTPKEKR